MKNYEVHVQNMKDGKLDHDYNIQVGDPVTTLCRSNGAQWSESARNEVVGSLIDDGNGVTIELKGKKKPISLDYMQMAELQLLLLAAMESSYVTQIKESRSVISYTGLAK